MPAITGTLGQVVELLQMEDNFTFQPDNPFRKSFIGSWQTNFTSVDASFQVLAVRYEDLLAAPEQEIAESRVPEPKGYPSEANCSLTPSATCPGSKIGRV